MSKGATMNEREMESVLDNLCGPNHDPQLRAFALRCYEAGASSALSTPPVASGGLVYWDEQAGEHRIRTGQPSPTPTPAEIAERCPECRSNDTAWYIAVVNPTNIVDGKLRVHDVLPIAVLGCNHCSHTIKREDAGQFLPRLLAALREREAEVGRLSEALAEISCIGNEHRPPNYYWANEAGKLARAALAKPDAEKEVSQ